MRPRPLKPNCSAYIYTYHIAAITIPYATIMSVISIQYTKGSVSRKKVPQCEDTMPELKSTKALYIKTSDIINNPMMAITMRDEDTFHIALKSPGNDAIKKQYIFFLSEKYFVPRIESILRLSLMGYYSINRIPLKLPNEKAQRREAANAAPSAEADCYAIYLPISAPFPGYVIIFIGQAD
jgi:hypothetical protein